MQFHAKELSVSAAGDYYQLYLGPKESEECQHACGFDPCLHLAMIQLNRSR